MELLKMSGPPLDLLLPDKRPAKCGWKYGRRASSRAFGNIGGKVSSVCTSQSRILRDLFDMGVLSSLQLSIMRCFRNGQSTGLGTMSDSLKKALMANWALDSCSGSGESWNWVSWGSTSAGFSWETSSMFHSNWVDESWGVRERKSEGLPGKERVALRGFFEQTKNSPGDQWQV